MSPKSHEGNTRLVKDTRIWSGLSYRRETLSLEIYHFLVSRSKVAVCTGERLPHPSRLLMINTILRSDPAKEWSEPCILGTPGKNMHESSKLMVYSLPIQV